jgi:hypothetical protein
MPLRYSSKGEIMDDSNATESFEAKGAQVGPPSDPLTPTDFPTSADPRFNYATCTNCGYSIFFDAEISNLPE